MLTRLAGAVSLLALFAAAAFAQEPATLVLRSGERVRGELVDMGGADFEMWVSGQSRRFPISDVVVIDFAGGGDAFPDSEVSRVQAGWHLVVLGNGQSFDAQLFDIGGTRPLRITVRSGGGERNLSSSDIARIYLARPPGGGTPFGGGTPAAGGGPVRVLAGTYGSNCGAPRGNVTRPLAAACDGRGTCQYTIDYTVIGDPASGCPKNYIAEWQCGNDPAVRRAEASAEAGYRSIITLGCDGSAAPQPSTGGIPSAPSGGLAPPSSQGFGAREDGTSYTGTRLTYYTRSGLDQCQADCAGNASCAGFTWIQAGTYNASDPAMCYLMSSVTGRAPARGHFSAVKGTPGGGGTSGCRGTSHSVTVNPTIALPGGAVQAQLTSPDGRFPDRSWVGLFPSGGTDHLGQWKYLSELSNCAYAFTALGPGKYEIRLLLDGGYGNVGARGYFEVR